MKSSAILVRNRDMITRNIDGQAVIMDPQKGKVLALNEVGGFIWDKMDGTNTKEDILAAICAEFEVSKDEASADLDEFIAVLTGKDLITLDLA